MIRHKAKWLLVGLLLLPLWSAPPALADQSQLDGFFRSGVAAWERENYKEAERQISAALEEAERMEDSDKQLMATELLRLIEAEMQHSPDHEEVKKILARFTLYHQTRGYFPGMELLIERRLELQEMEVGPDDSTLALTLIPLGAVYQDQDRVVEAERAYKRAFSLTELSDWFLFPNVLLQVSSFYEMQGRHEEAEPFLEEVLSIYEETYGENGAEVGATLNMLALNYLAQGRYAEPRPLLRRALAINEGNLGPDHRDVAANLNNLALVYLAQGNYAEAEPLYQRALAILEMAVGPEHPDVATSLENYAALLRETSRADEAEKMEARAKAIRAKYE